MDIALHANGALDLIVVGRQFVVINRPIRDLGVVDRAQVRQLVEILLPETRKLGVLVQ